MTEPEVFLAVSCPICMRESLAGFRISVIVDAFESSELRLYADCHVVSWDASERELDKIFEYLYAMWTANPHEAHREIGGLDDSLDDANLAFIEAGDLAEFAIEDAH